MHCRRRMTATFSDKATSSLLGSMLVISLWFPGTAAPVSWTPSGTQSTADTPQELTAREVLNRQINGGETQSFTIAVAAGQFLHLRIEQHGSILLATLFPPGRSPEQESIVEMDSPAGGRGALPENYELILETLRSAEPADRSLIQAEKLFADGRRKFRDGDGASARNYYSRALPFWETANDYH